MKTKRILLTLIAALLALTLCFSLVGCGNDKKDKDDDEEETKATVEPAEPDGPSGKKPANPVDPSGKKPSKPVIPSSNDAEDIADGVLDAMYVSCDAEKIFDYVHPTVFDYLIEQSGQTTDEFFETFQANIDPIVTLYDTLDTLKIDWEFTNTETLSGSDLDEIAEDYDKKVGVEVEEAQLIEAEINLSATVDGNAESDSFQGEICVILIDGDWYFDFTNSSFNT